jgi:hypothetical protein
VGSNVTVVTPVAPAGGTLRKFVVLAFVFLVAMATAWALAGYLDRSDAGALDVPAVVGPVNDTVEPMVEPVTDTVEPIVQPVTDTVDPILEPGADVIESGVDPVTDVIEPVVEPILRPVIDDDPHLDPIALPQEPSSPATEPSQPAIVTSALSEPTTILRTRHGVPVVTSIAGNASPWTQSPLDVPSPAGFPRGPRPTSGDAPFGTAPATSAASSGSDLTQNLRTAGSSLLLAALLVAAGLILARSWRLVVTDRLLRLPIVFSTLARPG